MLKYCHTTYKSHKYFRWIVHTINVHFTVILYPNVIQMMLQLSVYFCFRIALKCYLSLPLVAGALLVGLPYSISLVAQWLYGWPSKPGYQKYLEAVKPRWHSINILMLLYTYCGLFNDADVSCTPCRRIYCLTRAVLEMLKYLQYGKLYFQWKLWYSNDKNNKHYVKVSTIFIFLLMLRKDVVYLETKLRLVLVLWCNMNCNIKTF